jgi:hypothetical protein
MHSPTNLAFSAFEPLPRHDEIAQCARELWSQSGQPQGRDEAIWLEAESRLIAARRCSSVPPPPRLYARMRLPMRAMAAGIRL